MSRSFRFQEGILRIYGYFDPVVHPLENFWWQDGVYGTDDSDMYAFRWISVLRLPDFVGEPGLERAVQTATDRKRSTVLPQSFLTIDEGFCVQIPRIGSFDNESARWTVFPLRKDMNTIFRK